MRQMVARLMARSWASLTRAKARSPRLQRVAGWSCSAVLLVAKLTTATSSSGGKAPGSAGAWGILQSGEAGGHEAFTPLADGVPVARQFRGDLLVVGLVGGGGAKDKPAAKDQGLRCRAGPDQGLELPVQFGGKDDARPTGTWHERPPCCSADTDAAAMLILQRPWSSDKLLAANF